MALVHQYRYMRPGPAESCVTVNNHNFLCDDRMMNQIAVIWIIFICGVTSNKSDLEAAVENVLEILVNADYDFWLHREVFNSTSEECTHLYYERYTFRKNDVKYSFLFQG